MRPKAKATIQRRPPTSGQTLFSAASTTDAAITDSTTRDGSAIKPSVASDKVIECARVNAVTTRSTSHAAGANRGTGDQRGGGPVSSSTAGSNSEIRNRMWSRPIQMCQTPSPT